MRQTSRLGSLVFMKLSSSPDHLSLEEWKTLAQAGQAPTQALLFKQYVAEIEKASADGSRKVSFTISTGSVDRDRDTLSIAGWALDNYVKNPVVLWAHYYGQPPIARAESIVKRAKALRATAQFATAEEYPFADTIFRLVNGGYLQATSVGFRPIKWVYDEDRRGYDITEQELLEFSIVPVPANPEALMDAKAAGICLEPLKAWAEALLDEFEPGLWVPKAAAKRALEIAAGEPKSVIVPAEVIPVPGEAKEPVDDPAALESKTFADSLPPFLRNPESAREAIRGALSDVASAEIARARGRLD